MSPVSRFPYRTFECFPADAAREEIPRFRQGHSTVFRGSLETLRHTQPQAAGRATGSSNRTIGEVSVSNDDLYKISY